MGDGVCVVLKAICNGTQNPDPHCTIAFFGTVDEQIIPVDRALNTYRRTRGTYYESLPLLTEVMEFDTFGVVAEVRVALLSHVDWLKGFRKEILTNLPKSLEIRSDFEFNPHITLGPQEGYNPNVPRFGDPVYLHTPQLWWGDLRFNL